MAALAARRRKGGTRFVPPKTAEDAVPVRRIWPDGVCLTDDGEYAKTWRVSDVNYAAASKEDKEAMFLGYSDLLNSFDSDARAKVTVAVRRLDAEALGRRILIPPKGDGLDRYREEYNAMLMEKATGANSMVREIYLTIAVGGRSIQEVRSYFNRASAETAAHLARLGAHCEELDAEGKLRLLRGFYRGGADDLPIDVRASMRRGHSFKDAVAPEGAGIEADRLRVGGRWARALYLTDYASYIKDGFLAELTDAMLNRVTDNWRAGRRTHIFIDEFHVVFENEYSGAFFNSAWRRFRKRNAYPTAITQNVEYLLDSVLASTMLSNSELIVMLNQAAADRGKLGELLNISREQMGYITNAEAGCGLLRYGGAIVPFANHFPRGTELYRLMTTKPGE